MIRVLVVDDYAEHVSTIVNTLNMYGCEARGTGGAKEGLALASSWEPHLVIWDGLMQEIKAWEFVKEFLSKNPPYRPYIVALTGFSSVTQRRLCEEFGCDEYVTKPIELSTLLGWVQKARERAEQSHFS